VLWGANSYETSTVFFVDHMLPNLQMGLTDEKSKVFRPREPVEAARMVLIVPRKSATVALALQ
jgi:arsenite oxidase large subunit